MTIINKCYEQQSNTLSVTEVIDLLQSEVHGQFLGSVCQIDCKIMKGTTGKEFGQEFCGLFVYFVCAAACYYYAPINCMPHYPPYGQRWGFSGDLIAFE